MVQVRLKTFEDLIGNVGDDVKDVIEGVLDDTKVAFDEIVGRSREIRRPETTGAASTTSATADGGEGPAVSSRASSNRASDVRATMHAVSESVSRLEDLPKQIAELSSLISSLVIAVQGIPGFAVATTAESQPVLKKGN